MRITPELVARKLREIAEEHGAPNGAGLDEIAGASHRLAVAHVLRWQLARVNAALSQADLVAVYEPRGKVAARIVIDRAVPKDASTGRA